VLEATGELEEALIAFQRADKLGIERAKTNIRNVSSYKSWLNESRFVGDPGG